MARICAAIGLFVSVTMLSFQFFIYNYDHTRMLIYYSILAFFLILTIRIAKSDLSFGVTVLIIFVMSTAMALSPFEFWFPFLSENPTLEFLATLISRTVVYLVALMIWFLSFRKIHKDIKGPQ